MNLKFSAISKLSNFLSVIMLIIVISGCASSIKISREEFGEHSSTIISKAVLPASVVGLVTNASETITFEENSATLNLDSGFISGTRIEGSHVRFTFTDIKLVKFGNTDIAPRFLTIAGITEVLNRTKAKPNRSISNKSNPYWDVIKFDAIGGKFDNESGLLTGVTIKGTNISVGFDRLKYVEYRKPNKYKTFRSFIIITSIALLINNSMELIDILE